MKRQGWFIEKYTYEQLWNKLKRDFLRKPTLTLAAAIIALANGRRVGEAINALTEWLKSGAKAKSVQVKIEKKRATSEDRVATVYIPQLLFQQRERLLELFKRKKSVTRFGVYRLLRRRYRINTHTLRYMFITHMAFDAGLDATIIAQMIHYSNLSMLLRYTSKQRAERELEEFVESLE